MVREVRALKKVLVCNRGEIAIRIFRACTELGIQTVAIYSHEDRFSLHRYKADEAYEVGQPGSPVSSYLNIEEIMQIAKRSGVDAVHPGYGFLSERADLRRACEQNGIIFVGPSVETLEIAGDKTQTRELAERLNVPVIPGSSALGSFEDARKFANEIGYPVMLKAAHGGGGRGMRIVKNAEDLENAFQGAAGEAGAAFGRAEIFIEKYVSRPKHLEVQLLGDGEGGVLHLFERDCSVQRRHQKIVEYAPAIGMPQKVRDELYQHALTIGRGLKLQSAATAEFLVDENQKVFFIEMNPRIQVEHTVTEEITGLDLVQSQLKIAGGATLKDLNLRQEELTYSGVAIQCRITTEDPANGFTPDYGKLLTYRSAGGFGIRLDAGSAYTGSQISPFYDSLLVKVTARGRDMAEAVGRLSRALREFRIRGVKTNISFLDNLIHHEMFLTGNCKTTFLEEHPELFELPRRRNRANRMLNFLADVTVNGHELMPGLKRPAKLQTAKVPPIFVRDRLPNGHLARPPLGWRDQLLRLGVKDFLKEVRRSERLLITDTTFRDAHQSLLATRVRTFDLMQVAEAVAHNAPGLFSLEMWGGATFDVALRFLKEDPWERLILLREKVPNILFQMLIRGTNAVGYTSYPENVVRRFIEEAHKAGMDIFRIFDCLNNLSRMRVSIEATKEAGGIAEVCICYTGDLISEEENRKAGKGSKFNLKYYTDLAKSCVKTGADIIAIKDMAGLLRPYSAELLIRELRQVVDVPIHFHTHDTAGVQSASYLKAAEAGVDIVDCAFSSMSGVTSQPTLEGIVAALANTKRDTKLELEALTPFSTYWETVRNYYAPFESDLKTSTAEVYDNEIPGGQYSNFRPQAESLGVGDRIGELKRAYKDINDLLGGIVKVTPSSKVVGDFALFMVINNLSKQDILDRADELDFPASVIEFFQGELGEPYGGFPQELRTKILRGREIFSTSAEDRLPPADFDQTIKIASELIGKPVGIHDALSYLMYPAVYKEYAEGRKNFGNLSVLPTPPFLYGMQEGEEIQLDLEPGKRLFISLEAVGEPGENGERPVFFELNGHPRSFTVRDRKITSVKETLEKIDSANPKHIGASLAGAIVAVNVKAGDNVEPGQPLFTLEAMKMQTIVEAHETGRIKRVPIAVGKRVSAGDLIIELE